MTPEQFCYWLQGFVELTGTQPTEEQWLSINDHLKTVFRKVTPSRLPEYPQPFRLNPALIDTKTVIC